MKASRQEGRKEGRKEGRHRKVGIKEEKNFDSTVIFRSKIQSKVVGKRDPKDKFIALLCVNGVALWDCRKPQTESKLN